MKMRISIFHNTFINVTQFLVSRHTAVKIPVDKGEHSIYQVAVGSHQFVIVAADKLNQEKSVSLVSGILMESR